MKEECPRCGSYETGIEVYKDDEYFVCYFCNLDRMI